MIFNSFEFAIFLPLVFLGYWFVFRKSLKAQNIFIIGVSYLFYGWWDWRFLSLIFVSSLVDYLVGLGLLSQLNPTKRKWLLATSLVFNLGILGFFKYYNFFVDAFIDAFATIGIGLEARSLQVILPVGISFYTFQTLSYSIDVYRRHLEPTRDLMAFMAYVSFFPQLVAGPIERAIHLLPQFYVPRKFDFAKAQDGMRQILWGLFKKIVIADNAAVLTNQIFDNYTELSGSTLLLGAVYFAFQIYCDFSGYSDIAIGTARLFGFDIMRNFALPYFSRDIAEFWRRWHISLSTWFRDYLYIPLGGSRGNHWQKIRNTLIVFTVSGFWHGANWTFVAWGLLNGLYFIPLMLLGKNRKNMGITSENCLIPSLRESVQMLTTFFLTLIAWVFFRAENIGQAFDYLAHMFSPEIASIPQKLSVVPLIVIFVLIEWVRRDKHHALEDFKWPVAARWSVYLVLVWTIIVFGQKEVQDFIYFQF